MTVHGDTRVDPYFWLRDREDPATLAYLSAENAWTDASHGPTRELQETLYQELLGRIQETDLSVPSWKAGGCTTSVPRPGSSTRSCAGGVTPRGHERKSCSTRTSAPPAWATTEPPA
jgi:hypothetical protein